MDQATGGAIVGGTSSGLNYGKVGSGGRGSQKGRFCEDSCTDWGGHFHCPIDGTVDGFYGGSSTTSEPTSTHGQLSARRWPASVCTYSYSTASSCKSPNAEFCGDCTSVTDWSSFFAQPSLPFEDTAGRQVSLKVAVQADSPESPKAIAESPATSDWHEPTAMADVAGTSGCTSSRSGPSSAREAWVALVAQRGKDDAEAGRASIRAMLATARPLPVFTGVLVVAAEAIQPVDATMHTPKLQTSLAQVMGGQEKAQPLSPPNCGMHAGPCADHHQCTPHKCL